ncbi:hypothetical protein MBLNU230_g5859t1 [Neophaeotheca triangularis]
MASKPVLNVEANSLSSVTDIASNPPAHPGVPVDEPLRPLTLYIAKVPGSQDVFLTPLKPREKVVSAEDVLSALYYVHFNSEHDKRFVEEPFCTSPTTPEPPHSPAPDDYRVQRKPLPPPRSPRPGDLPTPPGSESEYFPTLPARKPVNSEKVHARQPVVSDRAGRRPNYAPDLDLPDIPRRPCPSPLAELPSYSSSWQENSWRRSMQSGAASDENNPYFRTYSHPEGDLPSPLATEHSPPASPSLGPEPGTLTLIRRDPGSTEQWNVATIHDPPVQEVSSASLLNPSSASSRTKRGGAPMFLDVTNPGYFQFIDLERPVSRNSTSTFSSADDPPPEGTFRRRMYMPGSAFGEHSYSPSTSTSLNRTSIDMRPSFSSNRDASLDLPRTLHTSRTDPYPDLTSKSTPRFDRRSKNYTFASPYPGGQCTFQTSASGRALKCRHLFPSIQTSSSFELSELRFNLPIENPNPPQPQNLKSSHGRASSLSSTSTTPLALKRKSLSKFTQQAKTALTNSTWPPENQDQPQPPPSRPLPPCPTLPNDPQPTTFLPEPQSFEQERMDLSLGQESAGGGLGGKQAKLGKLIIEPEGLKMLDLLVAANVGLWWRAYGRGKG